MIGVCVSLYKSLSEEPVPARQWLPAGRRERMVGEEADATRGTKSG
jgi:hypothetical protein